MCPTMRRQVRPTSQPRRKSLSIPTPNLIITQSLECSLDEEAEQNREIAFKMFSSVEVSFPIWNQSMEFLDPGISIRGVL